MQIQITISGETPLLMHSAAGVDSEHPINKQLAPLAKKTASKRTADDNREIRRLEWLKGIYTDGEQVVYPTANVVRCLKEAGKVSKQGTQIVRGLSLDGIEVPLAFARNGHKTVEDLFNDAQFVDTRAVGVGVKRIMRTRPRFLPWGLITTGELFDDVMDLSELRRIAELAGRAVGLGDNRVNGFGRFTVTVEAI